MGELRQFLKEEDAVGVVEIILILVVLIGLVIIFKDQITSLVKSILEKITNQSNTV
ncbi:MAG TPA: holin, BlyA family protein [Candidatus Scatomonas merdigallinarum]|nr:holin, BlyA family protein [Candidatus Scatomonas merdigallinarum]